MTERVARLVKQARYGIWDSVEDILSIHRSLTADEVAALRVALADNWKAEN